MTEFVTLTQIQAVTPNLQPQGSGRFAISVAAQRSMLSAFLNLARASLAAGLPPEALPAVVVSYRKVTKAKRRIIGEDFRGLPGVSVDTHIGRAVKVARNKAEDVYFTLLDANRDGDERGFTAIRPEGIRGFAFSEPSIQEAFLVRARTLVGGAA